MNIKKQLAVWFGCVLAVLFFTPADVMAEETGTVKVIINDQLELEFASKVRMSDLLSTALAQWQLNQQIALDVYWPNVRLAQVGDAQHLPLAAQEELEAERLAVIEELSQLATTWLEQGQREYAAQAMALVEQLSSLVLAWQPFGTPQLEASRLFLDDNPLLHEGVYHLHLPEREAHFYLYGLTKSAGKQPIYSQQTVRGYLLPHKTNGLLWPSANLSDVYHIKQTQAAVERPWAIYNAQATPVLPGDILFLGFAQSSLSKNLWPLTKQAKQTAQLNQRLANLLRHWWADPSAQWMDSSILQMVEQRVPALRHWERLDLSPSRNNYGGVGLIQTPTARMAAEGEAVLGYTDMNEYRRYNASIQILPWLETTGFYVQAPNRLYSPYPGFSGDTYYTDKGFDVKVRLWQESNYIPEIAVGLSDFAGTGLFSSEYIVANKRWGPFDLSFGVGFGRLGTRDSFPNIFCEITDRFCERETGYGGMGGKPEISKWFRGDAAFFGGVEYQTPFTGVRLKVEYEGNDYSKDRAGINIEPRNPLNVALLYRPSNWFDVQLGFERGDIFTVSFNLRTNLGTISPTRVVPEKVAAATVPEVSLADVRWRQMQQKMRQQFAYSPADFSVNESGDTVTAFVQPLRFRDTDEAVERAARVMAAELPATVTTYEIVEQSMLMPVLTTRVPAAEFRAQIANEVPGKAPEDVKELFVRDEPLARPAWDDTRWQEASPYRFKPAFGVQPFFIQDFGSPETFQFYQFGLKGSMHYWFDEKTWLVTDVGLNLSNNYHKFNFKVDAFDDLPLERVRTYTREYMDNDVWIDTMQLTRFQPLSDSFYAMAYAGILERMYAGVGGEVMWRPLDSPFALGLDVNWVKQRNFSGMLGMRDYTTATGFLTAYYQMPWLKDTMLQVGAGRFLARDTGVALQFQRRFESGIIVGAFAHLTNVSSADYGEGSFTKGVFINIPFDLMSIYPNRKRLDIGWVPLSRDGGQALMRRATLYGVTDGRSPYYMR